MSSLAFCVSHSCDLFFVEGRLYKKIRAREDLNSKIKYALELGSNMGVDGVSFPAFLIKDIGAAESLLLSSDEEPILTKFKKKPLVILKRRNKKRKRRSQPVKATGRRRILT